MSTLVLDVAERGDLFCVEVGCGGRAGQSGLMKLAVLCLFWGDSGTFSLGGLPCA